MRRLPMVLDRRRREDAFSFGSIDKAVSKLFATSLYGKFWNRVPSINLMMGLGGTSRPHRGMVVPMLLRRFINFNSL